MNNNTDVVICKYLGLSTELVKMWKENALHNFPQTLLFQGFVV